MPYPHLEERRQGFKECCITHFFQPDSEVLCAQCSYRDKPESAACDSTVALGAVSWSPAALRAVRDFDPDSLLN
jgi:hypothetical protein